jgi:4-hydroxy-3-polyprenylbenzoate decarboxylase
MTDRFIVAVSGASGSIYSLRLLEALRKLKVETVLVMSKMAIRVMEHETGLAFKDVAKLATDSYEEDDLFAPVASGSYNSVNIKAMGVVPCSMKTLSAIANGYASNLIDRAADVMLKEKKPLIIVPRETPLSIIHLKNMLAVAEAGALLLPPVPNFYSKPESLEDIVQQTVGAIIDHFGIPSDIRPRWQGKKL